MLLVPSAQNPAIGYFAAKLLASSVATDHVLSYQQLCEQLLPCAIPMDDSDRNDEPANLHKPITDTVGSLEKLGVFTREDDDVRLGEPFRDLSYHDVQDFRRALTASIMEGEMYTPVAQVKVVNDNVAAGSVAHATDLIASLSWHLMQNIYEAPGTFSNTEDRPGVQTVKAGLVGHEAFAVVLSNQERWFPYGRWSVFLGFGRFLFDSKASSGSKQFLLPDPTVAVRTVLQSAGSEGRRPLREVLDVLFERLPCLGWGDYAMDVAGYMSGDVPALLKDGNRVPSSVAHALLCLRDAGVIRLEELDDADDSLLFAEQMANDSNWTHISIEESDG